VFSHPQALGNVQTRMEDIMLLRNPSDPYASAPQVWEMLRSKMNIQ
jgi:hypothetical protein